VTGFRQAKPGVLAALRSGNFQHEARDVLAEKNLLAIGDVTATEVIQAVQREGGGDYSRSPHHADPGTIVHLLRPGGKHGRWYIKLYFLPATGGTVTFISVHL
jgi:hypothetical protein